MEIHSSSLRLPPVLINRPAAEKPIAVENNVDQDELKSAQKHKKKASESQNTVQTPAEIEQTLAQQDLKIFPVIDINDNLNKPFNKRAQQALNAYNQQLNQPALSQRTELISGIDFYV